jgi:lysozyme family protein
MSCFENYIKRILQNEGSKYTNDPNDPGGPTKWGIALKFIKDDIKGLDIDIDIDDDGDIDSIDIQNLTEANAIAIYRNKYWDKNLEKVLDCSKSIKILDMRINLGIVTTNKIVQKALVNLGYNLVIDGKIGPKSIAAIEDADKDAFVNELKDLQWDRYQMLIEKNSKLAVYKKGWYNRSQFTV